MVGVTTICPDELVEQRYVEVGFAPRIRVFGFRGFLSISTKLNSCNSLFIYFPNEKIQFGKIHSGKYHTRASNIKKK
jgi:hypothetical protein